MNREELPKSDRSSRTPLGKHELHHLLLTAISHSSTIGFAVLDRGFRFQSVNEAWATMDGVARKAHLGRKIGGLLGGAAKRLEPVFKKVLSTGASVLNHEYSAELAKRTEEGHWVISCFPIKGKSRKVKLVGAVLIEITNLRRLETWSHKLLTDSVRLLAPLSESDQLLIQAISNSYSPKSPVKKLRQEEITDREQQVIQQLARSKTNKEVAAALGVSVRTIETHRARIMLKLRIHSLSELVHFAIRNGIVQP